ncbi:sciellin isoform X2 [Perognathus longimembris pacificus]|uniref:sciellin isoform X2 n=1 Tax=Perognathus longimembris pacificus TaxID=214514 RepID=UPI002019C7E3|nr:sciellin isoform X2 [Perognathus longimembris pacificus]
MSNFPLRKKSPTGNDMKSSTQGTALKQQGFHEMNKRRAFLQDNSWIKTRPEEEKDENYGRVVLSRHNSHDALDRKITERDVSKVAISRYRSDDTLDRTLSTLKPPKTAKSQPGSLLDVNTTNRSASTAATTPVKKKRQSWFPPPPPGYNATPSAGASRRDSAVHPPIPPKPTSPVSSPNQLRQDTRQIRQPKTETNRPAERKIRSQDLDNIVKVAASLQKADKGEELDNLIKMNKSLNRNQGLDGLFRASPKAEQTAKRAQSLESLIYVNTRLDKDCEGKKSFGSLNKVNTRTDEKDKGQDLESVVKVDARTAKTSRSSKDRNNLVKVSPSTGKRMQGCQSLENLIKVALETNMTDQWNQDQNNLIQATPSANKRDQRLGELISVSPKAVKNTTGGQDLNKLIEVNREILTDNQRGQDLDNLIEVNSHVSENKNRSLDGQVNGFSSTPLHKESTRPSVCSYENRDNLSSSAGTRPQGPRDTIVYTRTYVENSKSPKDGYQENISGKYIQTVYSTSDRSVIERDMCTYCRKPLGVETKMILDELQISCHSTCFKCEICKRPLENLQAGDSIWIYRQTIHCEPCYSKVIAKWIQ